MVSYGSLLFYTKNGVSQPFSLSYGKTTIGSSESHHIRIKGEEQISCVLDSNEVGVTILVNENENKNILINDEPTSKYTVLKDGDHLEVGKKKFKYSNPSIKDEYLEQTQQTLNKKLGSMGNVRRKSQINSNPLTPLKRLQKVDSFSKHRRFSTGSKLVAAKSSPIITGKILFSKHTSTPQSPSRVRFSQRMLTRRNSTLASVMENEDFNFRSPKTTSIAKSVPRTSFLTPIKSPSTTKNKTFSGTTKFLSPITAKNKTYSGNISDVSENVTTPENNVTAASITPLNISKRSKNSLNRSRTLSYVDFPSSSTPRSAIKMNRSSSVYRPLVEDITPASPLSRSSLRNSSLKKLAFTERRSVNFDISSSSDRSIQQDSDSVGVSEESARGNKRKRSKIAELSESSRSTKKRKGSSSRVSVDDVPQDQNSIQDSSLSGIQNLSDTSLSSSMNRSVSVSSRSKGNISLKDESEHQSIVSWNKEMSSTDMNMSGLSECSSVAETSLKSKKSTRLSKLNESARSAEEIGNHLRTSFTKKTLQGVQNDNSDSENISLLLTRSSSSHEANLENSNHSGNFSENVSSSNLELVFDESLNDSSEDLKSVSSRSRRSTIKIQGKGMGKIRSKSLNLKRNTKGPVDQLSKTLCGNLMLNIPEQKSLRNVSSTPIVSRSNSVSTKVKSSGSKPRSKSLNVRNKLSHSLKGLSKTSTSLTLDFSPIAPKSSRHELFDENDLNETVPFVSPCSSSLVNSVSEYDSINGVSESVYKVEDSVISGSSKEESARKSRNSTTNTTCKTPKGLSKSKINKSLASSRKSSRSRSFADASELSSVFSDSSINDTNSSNIKVLFLTPNARGAPKRSKTPNLSFKSTNDPTDVQPTEELLEETFEKSSRRSTRSSKLTDSFTDLDDQKSTETSQSKSWKSVESETAESLKITPRKSLSGRVSSAKTTPQNIRNSAKQQENSKNNLTEISGAEELLKMSPMVLMSFDKKTQKVQKSPKNDLSNIKGLKKLLQTPRIQKSPNNDLSDVRGVKKLLETPKVHKSPKNDLTSVRGVKKLMKTPKVQKPPKNDLTNVGGVGKLMKTPKVQKPPKNDLTNVGGVKKLMSTPKVQKSPKNDLTNVAGVKKLMSTPKVQKSPKNDLTNVAGVKKLMSSRKVQKSPKNDLTNVAGVKKLMSTPKVQKSPKNDLTNVAGVKKLMSSRKVQKSPKNDLTNVAGVKKLMSTPKVQKSPKNDLTNVGGVKKLMITPKLQKSPKNDLTNVSGLKKLMTSPKQLKSQKNNLSDVEGIKNILKTPRAPKSSKNDLLDVTGIRNLLRTSKNKTADESHDLSGIDILFNESRESNFDKLLDKKPLRTYSRSPKANKSQEQQPDEVETPEHVLKWIEEQSKLGPTTETSESKKGKRKLAQASDETAENIITPNKRQKVTRTRLANPNKEESMLNISSTIRGKPSSTPKVNKETTPHTSKTENDVQTDKKYEQTGTRSLRGKRKLERNDKTDEEPSLKKTRGNKSKKTELESEDTNKNEIKSPVGRKTRKTRQAKQQDDKVGQLPEEVKMVQQKGRKKNEISKDLSENIEPTEKRGRKKNEISKDLSENIEQTKTRSRKNNELGKDLSENIEQTEKKPTTKRTRGKKETEKTNTVEEETREMIKNTRSKKSKQEAEIVNNDSTQSKKENDKEKIQSENVATKQEPKKTRNKKVEEKSMEAEDNPQPIGRGRNKRGKIEELSTEVKGEPESKKRGNRSKKVADNESNPKPNKRGKNIAHLESDEETEEKENVSNKGKNSKKNEGQENKHKPEPPIRKTTRRMKTEEDNSEIKNETRTTRSNKGKNKKYNDEEWDTPVKKNNKKQTVTFKDDVEYLKTPAESITDGRTLRKRRNVK